MVVQLAILSVALSKSKALRVAVNIGPRPELDNDHYPVRDAVSEREQDPYLRDQA